MSRTLPTRRFRKLRSGAWPTIPERWDQIAYSWQSKVKKRTEISLPLRPWSEAPLRSFRKTMLPAGFSGCWIQVDNARQALAGAAASFYRHPTRAFELIGITGTNGKTSTAYLIESILIAAGERVGVVSTIEYRGPEGKMPAERTTPESLDLQALFAKFVEQHCGFVVMEVSSHALDMDRVHACRFRSAVFTNLTQDHLDYHHTMENYFLAKQRLFLGTGLGPPGQSVINRDDPRGPALEALCAGRCVTYSIEGAADFQILDSRLEKRGLWVRLKTPEGNIRDANAADGETKPVEYAGRRCSQRRTWALIRRPFGAGSKTARPFRDDLSGLTGASRFMCLSTMPTRRMHCKRSCRLRASCNRNACCLSSAAAESATEPSVLRWHRLPRRSPTLSGSPPTTRVARIQCRSWLRSKLG